jgi:hypothetical protein
MAHNPVNRAGDSEIQSMVRPLYVDVAIDSLN